MCFNYSKKVIGTDVQSQQSGEKRYDYKFQGPSVQDLEASSAIVAESKHLVSPSFLARRKN